MKYLIFFIVFAVSEIQVFGQTYIDFIIKDAGQHKIDKVDAFDLSQKELYDFSYQDTMKLTFNKKHIDCYVIRYYENDKMFSKQIWLDTGHIKVVAHIDSESLVIDTVINSPFYYKDLNFVSTYGDINKSLLLNSINRGWFFTSVDKCTLLLLKIMILFGNRTNYYHIAFRV